MSTRTPISHRVRVLAVLAAVVTLAATFFAPASPANAGAIGESGGSNHVVNGGGGGPAGNWGWVYCETDLVRHGSISGPSSKGKAPLPAPGANSSGTRGMAYNYNTGQWKVFYNKYPGCEDKFLTNTSDPGNSYPGLAIAHCQIALEVWRFYGTPSTKAQGYTVSRSRPSQYCSKTSHVLFAPHPHDALSYHMFVSQDGRQVQAQAFTSPWTSTPGRAQTARDHTFKVFKPDVAGDYMSTDFPFRYGGKTCVDLQQPNKPKSGGAAEPYFNGALKNDPAAEPIRAAISNLEKAVASQWKSTKIGRATVNKRADNGRFNDSLDCSSDLDFWSSADFSEVASDANRKVFAVCYIPVYRTVQGYADTQTSGNITRWAESIWSNEYYSWPQTKRTLPGDGVYRNVIRAEIASRGRGTNAALSPDSYRHPVARNDIRTPLDPTHAVSAATTPAQAQAQAGVFAAVYASCAEGSGSLTFDQTSPPEPPPLDDITFTVNADEIGGVGGARNCTTPDAPECTQLPVTVTASKPLPCATTECRYDGEQGTYTTRNLSKVTVDFGVGAPKGYVECTGKTTACDYKITQVSYDAATGSSEYLLEFYRATPPDDGYDFDVAVTAVYKGMSVSTVCTTSGAGGTDVAGNNGTAGSTSPTCVSSSRSRTWNERPDVSAPDEIPVVGPANSPF